MKQIVFSILHTGWVEKDKSIDVNMYGMGMEYDRTPAATWWRVPCTAVLVSHPEVGYLLYDGGVRPDCRFGQQARDTKIEAYTRFFAEPDQAIEQQLAKCGISVSDLSMVILSDLSWTHTGILPLLSGQPAGRQIVVPQADFAYGATETLLAQGDVGFHYRKCDFWVPDIGFRYIEQDTTLADGVRVLHLPGSRPASLGLLLETSCGTYVFPGRAMPCAENFTDPATPSADCYDSLAFQQSASRLRELYGAGAKLMLTGDPQAFASWKTAPYFYGEGAEP